MQDFPESKSTNLIHSGAIRHLQRLHLDPIPIMFKKHLSRNRLAMHRGRKLPK